LEAKQRAREVNSGKRTQISKTKTETAIFIFLFCRIPIMSELMRLKMKYRIKVKGECEVEANDEDEAITNALIYFAEDMQGNLDVEEVKEMNIKKEKEECYECGKKIELDVNGIAVNNDGSYCQECYDKKFGCGEDDD